MGVGRFEEDLGFEEEGAIRLGDFVDLRVKKFGNGAVGFEGDGNVFEACIEEVLELHKLLEGSAPDEEDVVKIAEVKAGLKGPVMTGGVVEANQIHVGSGGGMGWAHGHAEDL